MQRAAPSAAPRRSSHAALIALALGLVADRSVLPGAAALPPEVPETTVDRGCGLDSEGPICFDSGDDKLQVLLPPALPAGVQGYWSFDEGSPVDSSGNQNHGVGPVCTAGPSFAGQGSSALFHRSFLTIPGERLRLYDFTYSWWLHLLDDPAAGMQHQGAKFCPLLRKGRAPDADLNLDVQQVPATPAVLLDRATRRLRVEIATQGGSRGLDERNIEVFSSNARLSRGRWYHIALVRLNGQRHSRLYVNGILDASHESEGFTPPNAEPLYVGSDPAAVDQCDVPVYIDELKAYSRSLSHDEIQAEAAPSLAGIEPSFVRLSCTSCSLDQATQNCPEGYHLCNSLELHMGGYQVARTLGWIERGTHVWSHSSVANGGMQAGLAGPAQRGINPANTSKASSLLATGKPQNTQPAMPGVAMIQEPTLGLGLCCADA